ncbi:MAG: HDOD domain-containing protein [Terriglobia bacterium]
MACDPSTLIKGGFEVPSLPIIFTRLNAAVNDPRASFTDISRIISEDPSLTARLLRIVNSALYSLPTKIETILRAVTIVGTQQVRDLALATSVVQLFKGIPEDLISMESFWRHSLACGVTSRILATFRREANVERYFVGGMLHDIGRLVICMVQPDAARAVLTRCRQHGELLNLVEMELLGFDHAAVGGFLLRTWKLPDSIQEMVAFHHRPQQSSRFPAETAIIHVADILTHVMELESSEEQLIPPLVPEAWERIGLPVSVLSGAMDQIRIQFGTAVQTILPKPTP